MSPAVRAISSARLGESAMEAIDRRRLLYRRMDAETILAIDHHFRNAADSKGHHRLGMEKGFENA
jgi:hypothetical protein